MGNGLNKFGKNSFKRKPEDLFGGDEDISLDGGWEYLNRLARVKRKPNFAKINSKKKVGGDSKRGGDAKGRNGNKRGQSEMDF